MDASAAPHCVGIILVILKTLAGQAKRGSLTFDKWCNLHFSRPMLFLAIIEPTYRRACDGF
jgi:hypothetical protein